MKYFPLGYIQRCIVAGIRGASKRSNIFHFSGLNGYPVPSHAHLLCKTAFLFNGCSFAQRIQDFHFYKVHDYLTPTQMLDEGQKIPFNTPVCFHTGKRL